MSLVSRVKYDNRINKMNFEIVKLSNFFRTRPSKLIETDFRLDFWMLMYITEGEGIHYINFKEYRYKAGDLILLSKNQIHSFRTDYEVKGYMINVNEPFFFEGEDGCNFSIMSFFEVPYEKPILELDISNESTSRRLIELIYREYNNASGIEVNLIKSLFLSFVYSIRRENREYINEINENHYKIYYRFKQLVEEHFIEIKSVGDYAQLMKLSRKTINLACRKSVDLSAKEVIINRIILEIKRLLSQKKLLNYEISYELGFDEPSNLAGFFKRNTGMSMNEFRKTIG
ncbi:MAG: helix-turn-helix transcriptional regulator [Tissierellales bacterium]|jgi:AraC-like DNA-binding protein|nr:helix-turn-helix transcriptional regulator [Tissierellales bacterium]